MSPEDVMELLRAELKRIGAEDAIIRIDEEFEPEAGPLIYLEIEPAYWHFLPGSLLPLLQELADGAGSEAIKEAIERNASMVWHGPAPEDSRDTSP